MPALRNFSHNLRFSSTATALACLLWTQCAVAQNTPTSGPATADAATAAEPDQADPCSWELQDQALQERSQEVLEGLSCYSLRWFDGLFGDRFEFDTTQISGLLKVGAEYTEYDGFDPKLRLRVRATLPNVAGRWDVLIGRVDEGSYIADTQTQDETFYNPGITRADESEWLLGLGHRSENRKQGWDYSVGVRLRVPPRLYAKTQYYYNKAYSEASQLRMRQTVFWKSNEGLGATSRADFSHALSFTDMLRWEVVGTVSQEREGLDWFAGQTWYHLFPGENAISLLGFARGETAAEVALQEYGLNLVWRRPFTRDWVFLTLGPSLTWPRYRLQETRRASWGFGVWIEMEFGDYRY